MNIEEMINAIRAGMAAKLAEREEHRKVVDAVRTACAAEENRAPSEEEAGKVRDAQSAVTAIDAEIDQQQARIAELGAEKERDEAAARLAGELHPTGVEAPKRGKGGAIVTGEPRTYSRESSSSGEARFFSDAWNMQRGNAAAAERISRHAREVEVHGEMTERALATGGVAGLVIPQYLVDLAAPVLRAGRAFANACNRHQLPGSGLSLIVPRGPTGNSAAAQNGENTLVSETDQVWANLTVPVCTVAGAQPVSRQTLERGEGMDEVIFMDLTAAYAAQLGNYVINGSGAAGQPTGALTTGGIGAATAFGAVPGAANVQLKIAGAATAVNSAGSGKFAKAIFMHPRRWGWMTGLVDSTNRPIVTANQVGPQNVAGLVSADQENTDPTQLTIQGIHSTGLPIITDLNIPTNVGTNVEDVIIVADTSELHLWEDGDGVPQQLSFEQTAGDKLTTTLVVYSYLAFTAGRYPTTVAKIGGLDTVATQGLVAPTF